MKSVGLILHWLRWKITNDYGCSSRICCRVYWHTRRMVQGLGLCTQYSPDRGFFTLEHALVCANGLNRLEGLKMNAMEHFRDLYGAMDLSENDAARHIFLSGWNSALEEVLTRVNRMPLEKDTRASFAVYLQGMMLIDISELK